MSLIEDIWKYGPDILWFLCVIFLILFKYIPMMGSIIAFQDYSVFRGISGSPWAGFKHFRTLFDYPDFNRVFRNTLILGALKICVIFPESLILSLMINEIKHALLKKKKHPNGIVYSALSLVIVAGITFDIFFFDGLF